MVCQNASKKLMSLTTYTATYQSFNMEEAPKSTKKINVPLTFERIAATDKEGKEVKDREGNLQYKRDDYFGLMTLLNRYDTRKAGSFMKEARIYLNVKDKIERAWVEELLEVTLTVDEATFLKQFLTEIGNKPQEKPMADYEMRSYFGILDQLEEKL